MTLAPATRRRRPGRLVAALGTLAATLLPLAVSGTLAVPAASAQPPGAPAAGAPAGAPTATGVPAGPTAAGPRTAIVTLITGDRATVGTAGGRPSVSVVPAPRADGSHPTFVSYNRGTDAYVVPTDALPYLRSGALDEGLFDVTYLAGNGFGGARGSLPVIVQAAAPKPAGGAGTPAAAPAAPPGARLRRRLASIAATALTVPAAQAARFWAGIQDPAVPPAAAPTAGPLRPGRGLARVWLDRTLHVRLDQSVPLIGAPQAWAAGYDGTGVSVAILDTGVDLTHPDLAGRVAGSANFSTEPDITDRSGHGTHVASTIAGSGAASDGRYRGVAPGASLLIGKVCDGGGNCPTSSVLAGMQWAAASGARVVSLSLGGPSAGPNDPLVQAVDALTASTGTLFVIAAGNEGPGESTVGSPGLAAAALTVAATDKSDHLASFSSRGPLLPATSGGRLLKPDIAAPGVNIVAARAAGTALGTPVNDWYTTLSGTSMATPHVSGSAALLAEEHPDWRAPQLKAALMGSAKDDGYTAFEQGAGRVDVARAVRQQVYPATPDVDFGVLPYPRPVPVARTIDYANAGSDPVTLTLRTVLTGSGGGAAPAGTLAADQTVTVPAGGTATATVTLDAPDLPADRWSGAVVATDPTGAVQLRTPVAADLGPQLFPVQVSVLGRLGLPCGAGGQYGNALVHANANCKGVLQINYLNVDNPRYAGVDQSGGRTPYLLPAGHYLFSAYLLWDDPVSRKQQTAFLMAPEVTVTAAGTVTLDARTAEPVTVSTPQPSESYTASMGYWRLTPDPAFGSFLVIVSAYGFQSFWATPTPSVRIGTFLFFAQQDAAAPLVEMAAAGVALHPMYSDYRDAMPKLSGRPVLPLVDAGTDVTAVDPGRLRGKLVLLEHVVDRQNGCIPRQAQLDAAAAAGAAGLLLFEPIACFAPLPLATRRVALPVVTLPPGEALRLRQELTRHPVWVAVHGTPVSPYVYHLKFYQRGRIATVRYRAEQRDLARVRTVYHTAQHALGSLAWHSWVTGELTSFLGSLNFHMPLVRDEYGGPVQPDQTYLRDVLQSNEDSSEQWAEQYRTDPLIAGTTGGTDWFEPPAVPGARRLSGTAAAPDPCGACRQGDVFVPLLPLTAPDPAILAPFTELGPSGDLHLYRGEAEIPVDPLLGQITAYTLPAGDADTAYRLTQDLDTSFPDRPEPATRVRTEWTFRSSHPTADGLATGQACVGTLFGLSADPCTVQPLVFLRYALGADLHGRVVGRAPHVIQLSAYHETAARPTSPVTRLQVWTSYDDGQHWQPVTVTGWNGRFSAIVPAPPRGSAATAVSLRVTAADTAGDTVTQTVDRAYLLG